MNKPRYYRRDGTPYVGEDATIQWAKDFQKVDRVVGNTELSNGRRISTVWLGLDHRFESSGPPLIFETMVFSDDDMNNDTERYSTEEEAKAGHKRMVQKCGGDQP